MSEPTAPQPQILPHSPFVPRDPNVGLYTGSGRPFAMPYEFTGWRDEQMSWKETAYIHGNLNPTPTLRLTGPDALRFLSDHMVNSFENFPIGSGKHGIMCTEDGSVMADGVLLRLGEDDFITYWLSPYLDFVLMKGGYDVVPEQQTGQTFLFQIAGPRSLEILEAATGEDLRDIAFMRHRPSTIAGSEVRVLRMGMGGSLAYEVHGPVEVAHDVYGAIRRAGEPFGIRQLGIHAYLMNHTENGFPQAFYHFNYPWGEDPAFMQFLGAVMGEAEQLNGDKFSGSMGPDPRLRYRNPVELGWSKMIRFDHDFVGRAALEKIVAADARRMVTLVWNVDDILDVTRSQFEAGEAFRPIDEPNHFTFEYGGTNLFADRVLVGDDEVGVSSGRAYSYYYRDMISLCSIDTAYAEVGSEVEVLWGDPGTRQKRIRATVSRFPYLDTVRNQDVDVALVGRQS
ncbi:aminomethyltransferase family protein [Okibacterium endophyticum]